MTDGLFDRRAELVPGGESLVEQQARRSGKVARCLEAVFATGGLTHYDVVPSWEADAHRSQNPTKLRSAWTGRAFGTGGHTSTRLCLLLLDKLGHYPQAEPARAQLQTPLENGRAEILDVGCGCGVLALAALKLWPLAHALAIDIDQNRQVTRENTERDTAHDQISFRRRPKGFSASESPSSYRFGNLTGPALHMLCDDMVQQLTPGGVLISSGILTIESEA
ncbi:MAG: 50S ribosomal protein L11 methyltransferase [Polyangia bacterium]